MVQNIFDDDTLYRKMLELFNRTIDEHIKNNKEQSEILKKRGIKIQIDVDKRLKTLKRLSYVDLKRWYREEHKDGIDGKWESRSDIEIGLRKSYIHEGNLDLPFVMYR